MCHYLPNPSALHPPYCLQGRCSCCHQLSTQTPLPLFNIPSDGLCASLFHLPSTPPFKKTHKDGHHKINNQSMNIKSFVVVSLYLSPSFRCKSKTQSDTKFIPDRKIQRHSEAQKQQTIQKPICEPLLRTSLPHETGQTIYKESHFQLPFGLLLDRIICLFLFDFKSPLTKAIITLVFFFNQLQVCKRFSNQLCFDQNEM